MADSEVIAFEEDYFEVVDECLDDDASPTVTNNSLEDPLLLPTEYRAMMDKERHTNNSKSENNETVNKEIPVIKVEDECEPMASTQPLGAKNGVDYSADISLDNLNDQDVIENLNEIENIILDPETFPLSLKRMEAADLSYIPLSQGSPDGSIVEDDNDDFEDNERTEDNEGESSDIVVLGEASEIKKKSEISEEDKWYEEKLNEKQKIAKEKLEKLARVLKTYPTYEDILDQIAIKFGQPLCKLDEPRRCPLTEPPINRWKFVCTRKLIEEAAISETEEASVTDPSKFIWRMEPIERLHDNQKLMPTFVTHVLKIFEDFLNNLTKLDDSDGIEIVEERIQTPVDGRVMSNIVENEKSPIDSKETFLSLLIRCNRNKELLLFATGKNIADQTMERLKQLFETGKGKDCNVKSLYCKSLTKSDRVQSSNTTFLYGTEAIDERVANLTIQFAPKTNFLLNSYGAGELAKTVEKYLAAGRNTTVLDIGCGLGLMGLNVASKCNQVIGIDSPSEIEEAEMTCELNKIQNASFVMGEEKEIMNTISKSLANCRSSAIVNATTDIGRSLEVMKGLRRIPALGRVIMITTLTKLSVRAILELSKPANAPSWGDPFMPVRAVVVDTVPTSTQFELVIRMERRSILRLYNEYLPSNADKNSDKCVKKIFKQSATTAKRKPTITKSTESIKKSTSNKRHPPLTNKSSKKLHPEEPSARVDPKKLVKNPFYEKSQTKSWHENKQSRSLESPVDFKSSRQNDRRDKSPVFNRRHEIIEVRPNSPKESQKRKRNWDNGSGSLHSREKKLREHEDDLRAKLSGNRNEPDLLQKVKEQQKLLEVAKKKLTGVDSSTARQLQDMLNLAIEKTNQIQSQLPRSVWDRIAPAEHFSPDLAEKYDPMLNGRHVKELDSQDIVITTPNKNFEQPRPPPDFRKYTNAGVLEPNTIEPLDDYKPLSHHYEQRGREGKAGWKRDKKVWSGGNSRKRRPQSRNRENRITRQRSPSPVRRPSPQHRHYSPPRQNLESIYPHQIEIRRQVTPPRHYSPPPRPVSPPRREIMQRPQIQMQIRQNISPRLVRGSSPPRSSPPNRPTPPRFTDDWDIPSRGAIEQNTNWQRTIDNRPQDRWETNSQLENFRKGNNLEHNWGSKPSGSNNWNVGNDIWNNKPMTITAPNKEPWIQQLPDNRIAGLNIDNFNNRGREVENKMNSSRNIDTWSDTNKPRWESQQNKNWVQDKEDWNDLPEDAKDPWGDDGGSGLKDRWQKLDNPQQVNWKRDIEAMEWTGPKENWQNKGLPMNTNQMRPWGQNLGIINQNINNPQQTNSQWIFSTDRSKKSQPAGNWQPDSNNSWRPQQNFPGVFQSQRNFNSNNFNDGH